ncbi:MAG: phosphatidate cytidylyltransferase [Parachlamydiaceae bacterium]|nr:phosphatidate cytidylyltransferase [Parachlamydiaceae bacterium]
MLDKMSNFGQRVLVNSIVVLVVWLIIYYSFAIPFFYITLIAATIAGALSELFHLANIKKFNPLATAAIAFSTLYTFATYLSIKHVQLAILPEAILLTALLSFFGYYLIQGGNPLSNIAMTTFGIAYLAIPLSFLVKINYFFPETSAQDGRCWLLYTLFVTKMTDTGAYFVGKYIGRTPLAPNLSPKKTLEGAIGGLLTSMAVSVAFYFIANVAPQKWCMEITFTQSLLLGICISILAQFGDLAESLLKRDAGVKDSNNLPGVGGVFDMVDSIIFTAPLVYLFLQAQFNGVHL